jgi:hypothetical protein
LKRLLLLFFPLLPALTSFSQEGCRARISLLTCAPGDELYSTFGHTAVRVQDSTSGTDLVYNYGTFEFGPDFYMQFVRGKLLYFLSVENFPEFIGQYQEESRSVLEQVLQLSCAEKQKLMTSLQTNALPHNRYYRYDFLFDNCTTRARDIIAANTQVPVHYRNILPASKPTFRDLIHSYLDAGHEYWSKLGIDLLLGAKIDKKVTNQQAMFLPDYLLKGMDSAFMNQRPLVSEKSTLLQMPTPPKSNSLFQPAVIFSILLLVIAGLTVFGGSRVRGFLSFFDFLLFFTAGLAGVIMLFMWFGTDHAECGNNYNLLWALPTHLVASFFLFRCPEWIRRYFSFVFWLTLLLLVSWIVLPQQLNLSLFPIVVLILFRSRQIAQKQHAWKKKA